MAGPAVPEQLRCLSNSEAEVPATFAHCSAACYDSGVIGFFSAFLACLQVASSYSLSLCHLTYHFSMTSLFSASGPSYYQYW